MSTGNPEDAATQGSVGEVVLSFLAQWQAAGMEREGSLAGAGAFLHSWWEVEI